LPRTRAQLEEERLSLQLPLEDVRADHPDWVAVGSVITRIEHGPLNEAHKWKPAEQDDVYTPEAEFLLQFAKDLLRAERGDKAAAGRLQAETYRPEVMP